VEAFPLFQQVLTWLLFEPTASDESSGEPSSSTPSQDPQVFTERASPGERYWTMPVEYKIALLSFMCGLSVSSKAVHLHMESCEEQLTALRKEKIEINRSKKQA
jgi:bromodomain adjacent to zinc finger domain protein 1A